MRGRIKRDASVMRDFIYMRWPYVKIVRIDEESIECDAEKEDIVFDVEWKKEFWKCTAPGYGKKGNYGEGALYVRNFDDVELIKEEEEYQ